MELLIGLAILVAVNELKEWRQSNRAARQDRADRMQNRRVASLEREIKLVQEQFGLAHSKLDQVVKGFETERAAAEEARSFIAAASRDLSTIVNDFKVNGVMLGRSRGGSSGPVDSRAQRFDVVE